MNFLSSHFFLFLFFTLFFYYLFPKKFQYPILLAASLFFYLTISPFYTLLISILVYSDFIFAKLLWKTEDTKRRKVLFILGIVLNALFLLFFKFYYTLEKLLSPLIPSLNLWDTRYFYEIAVPLGVSYFVFKKISYLTDVYRGVIRPERNYFKLQLYVMFFAEIPAGPIDRASDLISQFSGKIEFSPSLIISGFQRVLWGIFKKVIIAERIAVFVDIVFKNYREYSGNTIIAVLFLYSIQIYCDFSAIADIAIGIGRMLGIRIEENFNRPYFAVSISDFWRRWHITLSTWLRDYIFLPIAYSLSGKFSRINLTGRRSDNLTYTIASITTMLICGLWHGSNWTFIIWGGLHGIFLIFSHLTGKMRRRIKRKLGIVRRSILNRIIKTAATFSLITFSWVFFRAKSVAHAFGMIGSIFVQRDGSINDFNSLNKIVLKDFPRFTLEILLISILILIIIEIIQSRVRIGEWILERPIFIRVLIYYFAIFTILIFTVKKSGDFIYMQF